MQVQVNGNPRELPDGSTVAALLEAIGAPKAGIAVEVNQQIVRRGDHPSHVLAAGDRVEIVGLVGGG